jgi:hypothetical protein
MVDETGGDQKIVLTVIFGVGELCAEPLDLEGAHFEVGFEGVCCAIIPSSFEVRPIREINHPLNLFIWIVV